MKDTNFANKHSQSDRKNTGSPANNRAERMKEYMDLLDELFEGVE